MTTITAFIPHLTKGDFSPTELKNRYEEVISTIQEEADKLRDKYLKEKYLNKNIKDEKK